MGQDVLTAIRENVHTFSKGQKKIAGFILESYDKAAFMTASRLGQKVGVSESTVVRFASELGYDGYPASTCISVNHVVIHGIPKKSVILQEGDIVGIDVGAQYEGFHGDNAWTFPCGKISGEAQALLDATEKALFLAIEKARPGSRLGDIGHTVQEYVEARSYSVVREFTGHGVGADMHEDPSVPNYGTPGRGVRLTAGMVIAIEPMINLGRREIEVKPDGWTVVTKDGSLSAHFEHTVAITPNGPVILTLPD